MSGLDLTPPEPITAAHDVAELASGEATLDAWLKQWALKNHASGASRCFVLCTGASVVGYSSLSAGAIAHADAPKSLRRNMPDPLPVLLLGRLAIDQRYHNQGLGQSLLRDAMLRAVSVAGHAGVFAILVQALSEPARQFYLSRGFVASPLQPMSLIKTLAKVRTILAELD